MVNRIVIIPIPENLDPINLTNVDKKNIVETGLKDSGTVIVLMGAGAARFREENSFPDTEQCVTYINMVDGFNHVKTILENSNPTPTIEAGLMVVEYPLFKYLAHRSLKERTNEISFTILPLGNPALYSEIMHQQAGLMIKYMEQVDGTKIG